MTVSVSGGEPLLCLLSHYRNWRGDHPSTWIDPWKLLLCRRTWPPCCVSGWAWLFLWKPWVYWSVCLWNGLAEGSKKTTWWLVSFSWELKSLMVDKYFKVAIPESWTLKLLEFLSFSFARGKVGLPHTKAPKPSWSCPTVMPLFSRGGGRVWSSSIAGKISFIFVFSAVHTGWVVNTHFNEELHGWTYYSFWTLSVYLNYSCF